MTEGDTFFQGHQWSTEHWWQQPGRPSPSWWTTWPSSSPPSPCSPWLPREIVAHWRGGWGERWLANCREKVPLRKIFWCPHRYVALGTSLGKGGAGRWGWKGLGGAEQEASGFNDKYDAQNTQTLLLFGSEDCLLFCVLRSWLGKAAGPLSETIFQSTLCLVACDFHVEISRHFRGMGITLSSRRRAKLSAEKVVI